MDHKIRVSKMDNTQYHNDCPNNKYLIPILIIGIFLFILYVPISIYVQLNLFDVLSGDSKILLILYLLTGFGYFAIEIISIILIIKDGTNLNVGRGIYCPAQRISQSRTWFISTWAILIFFFWIIFYPFYIYRRRELYEINKDYPPPFVDFKPLAHERKRNRGVVSLVILAIVLTSSISIYIIYQNSIQESRRDDGFTCLEAKEIGDEYLESWSQDATLIRAEEIEPMISNGKYSGWNLFYINTKQPTPNSLTVHVGVLGYGMGVDESTYWEVDLNSFLQGFNMANNSLTINTGEIIDTDEIYEIVNGSSIVRNWLESNPQHSYNIVLTANATGPVWDIEWGAKYTGLDPSLNHEGLYVQINANTGQINYIITETT